MILQMLRLKIADKLCQIEGWLPAEYRLTFLARHTTNEDAHILVTIDSLDDIAAAINKLTKDGHEHSAGPSPLREDPPAEASRSDAEAQS